MNNIKKRYWAMVLYPESAPINWKDKLIETGITCAISPLHDKDINPDNTIKKEHYHIILSYEGPTTYNNVKKLCDSLNQPIPQPLESIRGYYRYLVHKDNPEKFQYDERLIQNINGFDISNYLDLTASQVNLYLKQIQQMIIDNDIREYSSLMDLLLPLEDDFWEIAMKHTIFLNTYITSYRHKHIDK